MAEWWNEKALDQLSRSEWESLCDGCAKCCLHKLEDVDSGKLFFTNIRCRLLIEQTCCCGDYANRATRVPDCVDLYTADRTAFGGLPSTCAYRLRAENQPLPSWHPLVTGSSDSVHRARISIRGRTISEEYVHPDGFDEHIVHWVD
jgi:uncharacterized cysteine cluster protein YcgN (CxxCxxCC family)